MPFIQRLDKLADEKYRQHQYPVGNPYEGILRGASRQAAWQELLHEFVEQLGQNAPADQILPMWAGLIAVDHLTDSDVADIREVWRKKYDQFPTGAWGLVESAGYTGQNVSGVVRRMRVSAEELRAGMDVPAPDESPAGLRVQADIPDGVRVALQVRSRAYLGQLCAGYRREAAFYVEVVDLDGNQGWYYGRQDVSHSTTGGLEDPPQWWKKIVGEEG